MAVTFLGLTFGDDGTGFVIPSYADLRGALAAKIVELRGKANLNTAPGSIYGDIVDLVTTGVYVAAQSASDAVSRTVFTAMSGISLDQFLADLLLRVQASASTGIVWAYGSPGANIPISTPVRTSLTGTAFATSVAVVVPPVNAEGYAVEWVNFAQGLYAGQNFSITVDGTLVSINANGGTSGANLRESFIAAINALGQTQEAWLGGTNPNNNKLTMMILEGAGGGSFPLLVSGPVGAAVVSYTAIDVTVTTGVVVGPTAAALGTLRYGPPFAGVVGYTNVVPAVKGRLRETDAQFRARHQVTQRGLGGGSPDAIKAIMLSPVSVRGGGLTTCSVEYNPTDFMDAALNLPHSIRVICNVGGDPTEIGNAIWRAKAAGDNMNGDESVIIQDAEGGNQTIYFDYLVDRWISATITITPSADWPNTGDPLAQLRQDVTDAINALQPGEGVRVNQLPISTYPNGTPRGVQNFTVQLGASLFQIGPYNVPLQDIYPTVEPDANAASLTADVVFCNPPLTNRQRPLADITYITATIV